MRQVYHSRDNRLNFPVKCRYLSIDVELQNTIRHLIKAIDVIEEKLPQRDIHYFSFEIASPGNPAVDTPPDVSNVPFCAWESFNSEFWNAVLEKEHLHHHVKNWLWNIERVLNVAEDHHRLLLSLWESGAVQLGEPVATFFAMQSVEFVPYYTNLLRRWDMDHEVKQAETINRLVKKHGLCADIEELLLSRLTSCEGQHGLDHLNELSDIFESHYGDFTNSSLFRRVVLQRHQNHDQYVKNHEQQGHRSKVSFNGVFCRPEDCAMERAALQIYKQAEILPHQRN